MHTVYKALSPEEVNRIIAYCKQHTVKNGGLFEVYPDPETLVTMVVVNSRSEDKPVGTFYCNYLGPGIISLEEEDPDHDGMPSARRHIKALKQTIETLIGNSH